MGRPYKVTPEQVREADQIIQDDNLGLDGKRLTWEQLATEVGADVLGDCMKNTMQAALDYEKCLACVNGWLANSPMERRVEWATMMLARGHQCRVSLGWNMPMRCTLSTRCLSMVRRG